MRQKEERKKIWPRNVLFLIKTKKVYSFMSLEKIKERKEKYKKKLGQKEPRRNRKFYA